MLESQSRKRMPMAHESVLWDMGAGKFGDNTCTAQISGDAQTGWQIKGDA